MNLFEKVFRELNKAKVEYLVIGGVAVNLYGFIRTTGDLDLLLLLNKKNLSKMDRVMKKLKYSERLPVSIFDLSNTKKVKQWLKEKNMKAYTFNPPPGNLLQIDIVMEDSLKFASYARKKEIREMEELRIPVVALHDLIKMKKRAKRDKDMLDLKLLKYFAEL